MLFCPQRSGVKTRPCLQAPYILCTFYFLLHHESRHGWKALCEVRTPGPGEGGVRQELWGVVHTHTHTHVSHAQSQPITEPCRLYRPLPRAMVSTLVPVPECDLPGGPAGLITPLLQTFPGALEVTSISGFPYQRVFPLSLQATAPVGPTPRRVPIRSSCSQFRSENSISPEESSHPPEEHVLWFTPCTGRNDTTCSSL